jgi:hypothetical protein
VRLAAIALKSSKNRRSSGKSQLTTTLGRKGIGRACDHLARAV